MSLRLDDAFPSNYIRASDLGGKEHTLTISNITIETLGQGQDADEKPVVAFEGRKKRWVMNKTNALTLAGDYGQDMADWFGRDVILFSMKVQGPNGLVDGIRCRVPAEAHASSDHKGQRFERDAAAATESVGPGHGDDFDDDIPF